MLATFFLQKMERKYGFREKPIQSESFFRTGKNNYGKGILDDEYVEEEGNIFDEELIGEVDDVAVHIPPG